MRPSFISYRYRDGVRLQDAITTHNFIRRILLVQHNTSLTRPILIAVVCWLQSIPLLFMSCCLVSGSSC
jgi:hypothetical protein